MDLKSTDIVVLGAFNPAIITPVWLVEQHVIETATEPQAIELELTVGPRGTAEITFEIEDCRWKVSPERFVAEPRGPSSPIPKLKMVLNLLPHTPVRAVGMNFHFQGTTQAWKGGVPTLTGVGADDGRFPANISRRSLILTSQLEGSQVLTNLRIAGDSVFIDVNFHNDVRDMASAIAALERFENDLERARQLVQNLAGAQA